MSEGSPVDKIRYIYDLIYKKSRDLAQSHMNDWMESPEDIEDTVDLIWQDLETILLDIHDYDEIGIWKSSLNIDEVIYIRITEKIMRQALYIINGYGDKSIDPKYYFLIQQLSIPRDNKPTLMAIFKIAFYGGLALPFLRCRNYPVEIQDIVRYYKEHKLYDLDSYISIVKLENSHIQGELQNIPNYDNIINSINEIFKS